MVSFDVSDGSQSQHRWMFGDSPPEDGHVSGPGPRYVRLQSSLVHSHWSRNVEARLSLVESFPSDACASSLMP